MGFRTLASLLTAGFDQGFEFRPASVSRFKFGFDLGQARAGMGDLIRFALSVETRIGYPGVPLRLFGLQCLDVAGEGFEFAALVVPDATFSGLVCMRRSRHPAGCGR